MKWMIALTFPYPPVIISKKLSKKSNITKNLTQFVTDIRLGLRRAMALHIYSLKKRTFGHLSRRIL